MTMQTDMTHNKKVLIIGGTSGIGLEVAHIFSKDSQVVIVGRDINKISNDPSLKDSIKFSFDIGDEKQREELLKQIKDYDIEKIVHCAGIFKTENQDEKKYEAEYKNVKLGGLEIIKKMIAQHPKEITHICVVSSLYTFLPDSFSPKFEKQVQKELEKETMELKGVIANCIAPGLVRTPLSEKAFGEEGMKKLLDYSPGSRIVEPTEVAQEIYKLSNQNEIDKKIIPVDGNYLKFFKFNEFRENNNFPEIKIK